MIQIFFLFPTKGRYQKLKRGLSNTPWIIDGERKTASSVEEQLGLDLLSHFKAKSFFFFFFFNL